MDGKKGRLLKEYYELGEEAVLGALKDSGFEFKEIQAAFGGSVYSGAAVTHNCLKRIGAYGIPIVNTEAACGTSAGNLRLAYQAVAAGFCDVALAMGVEKMGSGLLENPTVPLWAKKLGIDNVPAEASTLINREMHDYGFTLEDIASVVLQDRRNADEIPRLSFTRKVYLPWKRWCMPP